MDFNFLKLLKTKDGYEYCERKGKDSVAFILMKKVGTQWFIGLRNEYKPSINTWINGAFGGSLDKKKSPCHTVIDEVAEEAGYKVKEENIKYCGKYFVSSQMNQFCMLYLVDVSNAKWVDKLPEDTAEFISDVNWFTFPNTFMSTLCWKAALLVNAIRF